MQAHVPKFARPCFANVNETGCSKAVASCRMGMSMIVRPQQRPKFSFFMGKIYFDLMSNSLTGPMQTHNLKNVGAHCFFSSKEQQRLT